MATALSLCEPTCCLFDAMACGTTAFSPKALGVGLAIRMPLWAMSLDRILSGRADASQGVNSRSDWLQVVRVNAQRYPAQVIQWQVVRHGALHKYVSKAMRWVGATLKSHSSIAQRGKRPSPEPARFSLINAVPEPFSKRHEKGKSCADRCSCKRAAVSPQSKVMTLAVAALLGWTGTVRQGAFHVSKDIGGQ